MNKRFFRIFIQLFLALLLLFAIPTVFFSVTNILKAKQEFETSYHDQQVKYAESLISVIEDKFKDLKDVCFFIQKEQWLSDYCKKNIDASDYDLVQRQKYAARLSTLLANAAIARDIAVIIPDRDTIVSARGWFTFEQYDFTYYPVRMADFTQNGIDMGSPVELYNPGAAASAGAGYSSVIPVYFNFYGDNLPYKVLFLIDKPLFADYIRRVSSGTTVDLSIALNGYPLYEAVDLPRDYEYVSPITNINYAFRFKAISNLYTNSFFTNNLLTIMVIFSFLFLVSLMIAYLLTKPLYRLYAKITPYISNKIKTKRYRDDNVPKASVFRVLETSINTLTEERVRLGRELDRYKKIVSNDDLLFNILITDDTEQYIDEIRDFWPWFNTGGYCGVVLLNGKGNRQIELYTDEMLDSIERCIPKGSVEYRLLNILNSDAALLLYFGEDGQRQQDGLYGSLFAQICRNIKASLGDYTISCGSIERGMLGIQTSYRQARREFLNLLTSCDSHETGIQYFYPISLELQLINYLKLSNAEKCAEILDVIFNQNKTRLLSPSQSIKLYTVIFDTLLRYAMEHDIGYKGYRQRFQNSLEGGNDALLAGCIQEFCEYLCETSSQRKKQDNISSRRYLYEYVYNNYFDPNMSLQLLSSRYKMPTSTLSKQFKETVGCNFYDFLCKTRIEKAILLIRENQHTITEIGRMVGYDNYASFKRAFVKFTGVSPSEFKKLEE